VLLEFGPAGDAPGGVDATGLGRSGDPFAFPAGAAPYVVLADWQVPAGSGVRSLNDFSVDDAGALYCVGSRSRSIVRFAPAAAAERTARIVQQWVLPPAFFDGADRRAEGLVALRGPAFLVAFDSNRTDVDNLARAVPVG
jgi:hypothetical protein